MKYIFLFFYCISTIIHAKETYLIIPSVKLEPYLKTINKAIQDAQYALLPGDFYLSNIARFIKAFLNNLPQSLNLEMKGYWRKNLGNGNYQNIMYVFFAYENPIIEAN